MTSNVLITVSWYRVLSTGRECKCNNTMALVGIEKTKKTFVTRNLGTVRPTLHGHDAWYMVHDVWSMFHVPWCMLHDATHRAWYILHNAR